MRQITVEELLEMGNGTKVRIEYSTKNWDDYCTIINDKIDYTEIVYTLDQHKLKFPSQAILCELFTDRCDKIKIKMCCQGKGWVSALYLVETKEDEAIDLEEYKRQRRKIAMEHNKVKVDKTQKSTLKNGDIVILRNGDEYRISSNTLLAINPKSALQAISLDIYNDDLTSRDREEYDIVKILHVENINKKTRSVEVRDSEQQLMAIEKVNNENLWQVFTNGNHKAITLTNNHIKYLHKKLGEIVEQMKGNE